MDTKNDSPADPSSPEQTQDGEQEEHPKGFQDLYTPETIAKLTEGFLSVYRPDLETMRAQMTELTNKQRVLVEQLHNENLKLSWSQNNADLQGVIGTIKTYRDKLLRIKRQMKVQHDRVAKLKKRALKLQQWKEKEVQARIQQQQYEEDLIAKQTSS